MLNCKSGRFSLAKSCVQERNVPSCNHETCTLYKSILTSV